MTPAMKVQGAYLQCFLCLLVVGFGVSPPAGAQALHVEPLPNGTELVVVAEPLSDATTVVWPSLQQGPGGAVTSGDLTLVADLEEAFESEGGGAAPAVVVAVGGMPLEDLRVLLERLLGGRMSAAPPKPTGEAVIEGRFERRLGSPGSEGEIRLEVNLPPPADPARSTVEVLWDLLPEVLADDLEGVRSRVDRNRGLLEVRTDPESADVTVRRLRLGLARVAENPGLEATDVDAAARRQLVRRRALMEQHPTAAQHLLDLWVDGRSEAVREFLFGGEGVTVEGVRTAARSWLPQHPGSTVLVLPPRSFNPRFAAPPEILQLDNGLTAAILQRSGASLATLCLRPVVVPDLDGELAATILARLAGELRTGQVQPGWVWVNAWPPQLELAAPVDGFGELSEILFEALSRVADDQRPVIEASGGSARRKALRLMGGVLGVTEGTALSPAELLRTGNLALGVVAEDGEAAAEALRKFWSGGGTSGGAASSQPVAPVPRTREAAAGGDSVLVVDLELGYGGDEALHLVMAELLESRAAAIFSEDEIEVLRPLIPGRQALLLVATAEGTVEAVEERLRAGWGALIAPAGEEELAAVRRRVAATNAAAWSGATGRARRCAAVAAGAVMWRPSSDIEMAILSVSTEATSATLAGFAAWEELLTTGAGMLPIAELKAR